MRVRIAVAVSEGRWIAYGAHDTHDGEVIDMLREVVQDHPATAWIELELPDEPPAQVIAEILPGTQDFGRVLRRAENVRSQHRRTY